MVSTAFWRESSDARSTWMTLREDAVEGYCCLRTEIAASPLEGSRQPSKISYLTDEEQRDLMVSRPRPVLAPVMRMTLLSTMVSDNEEKRIECSDTVLNSDIRSKRGYQVDRGVLSI